MVLPYTFPQILKLIWAVKEALHRNNYVECEHLLLEAQKIIQSELEDCLNSDSTLIELVRYFAVLQSQLDTIATKDTLKFETLKILEESLEAFSRASTDLPTYYKQ